VSMVLESHPLRVTERDVLKVRCARGAPKGPLPPGRGAGARVCPCKQLRARVCSIKLLMAPCSIPSLALDHLHDCMPLWPDPLLVPDRRRALTNGSVPSRGLTCMSGWVGRRRPPRPG
jgi:hypothetical protein